MLKSETPKLTRAFDATCRKGPRRLFGRSLLAADLLLSELQERRVQRDIRVTPVPAFRGMTPPEVHTSLSALDVKGAFVACQGAEHGEEGAPTIDFEAFLVCLALCGHVKYEEVEQMSLAQRVAGIIANFLGEKDEQQVLTEVLAPRVERLSTAGVVALPGMDAAVHALFMRVWAKMDLGQLYGFPLWEKAVFMLLHRSFPELHSIFVTYSKRDDSGSATALETMQQTELVDLALDCGLATAAFPMARVQLVFARADMTDDGKAGDQALELHEFLEAVVQLSFSRANPTHGEAGHENDAPAHPLPGCLEQMLHKNLMPIATRERLWTWREAVLHEATVQVVLCLGLG